MIALTAVSRKSCTPIGQLVVVRYERPSITICAEVFSRIEREGAGITPRADHAAILGRAMCLRAVLDDPQAVLLGEGHDRGHVRRLAVKVHRDDAHGARREFRFKERGIDGERVRIGVAKHHAAAGLCDCFRRGNPRVRRGDHFVARLDL